MDNNAIHELEPFWGNWYIDSFIGEGSFGKVYKIYREEFGDKHYAALKIISIPRNASELKQIYFEGMNDESASKYFSGIVEDIYNEIVLMTKLKGKTNIVSYEDHNIMKRKQGVGYDILIRMELLTSLNDYVIKNRLTNEIIVHIGIDICNALTLCEKRNIIHRDIKPDNIFLSNDGDFKLGDFGIAKQLDEAFMGLSIKGSYEYMAPEVYNGKNYDHRVDIYSLGLLLYTFLNKRKPPFVPLDRSVATHGERQEALRKRFTGEKLTPPVEATEKLSDIILKACSYNPNDRYDTAIDFKKALESLTKEELGVNNITNRIDLDKENGSSSEEEVLVQRVLFSTDNPDYKEDMLDRTIMIKQDAPTDMLQDNDFDKTVFLQKDTDRLFGEEDELDKTVLLPKENIMKSNTTTTESEECSIYKKNRNNKEKNKKDKNNKEINNKDKNKNNNEINNKDKNNRDINNIDKSNIDTKNTPKNNIDKNNIFKIIIPFVCVAIVVIGILVFNIIRNQMGDNRTNSTVLFSPSSNESSAPSESATPKKTEEPIKTVKPFESSVPKASTDSNLSNNSGKEEVDELILDYSNKKIKDLSAIKDLESVTDLTLDHNNLSDIEKLSKSIYITSLSINNNKIVDITPLITMNQLNYLWLSDNQIQDIRPLKNLVKLNLIVLDNNQIKDIDALEGLTNVTSLYLNNNKIVDINALKNLKKLEALSLSNNDIKDFSPLYGLDKLKTIDISGNSISNSAYKKLKEKLPKDCLIVK